MASNVFFVLVSYGATNSVKDACVLKELLLSFSNHFDNVAIWLGKNCMDTRKKIMLSVHGCIGFEDY